MRTYVPADELFRGLIHVLTPGSELGPIRLPKGEHGCSTAGEPSRRAPATCGSTDRNLSIMRSLRQPSDDISMDTAIPYRVFWGEISTHVRMIGQGCTSLWWVWTFSTTQPIAPSRWQVGEGARHLRLSCTRAVRTDAH